MSEYNISLSERALCFHKKHNSGEMRRMLDAVPAFVFVAEDTACSSIHGNAAAEALLRGPLFVDIDKSAIAAPITRNFEAFDADGVLLPADQLPVHRAARGEIITDAQFELRFEGGVSVFLHGAASPLRDEDGAVCGSVGAFTDISSWKMRERELQAEILALRDARVEADRTSLAKALFWADVSHDLLQPVQSLICSFAVVKRKVPDMPEAAAALKLTEASIKSLNAMLTGILDASCLDTGMIQPVITSVDLCEIVSRLAREYAPRAAADGLALRCRPRDLRARTDAILLERILRNLLENALRYTVDGGVLIGLRRRGDKVRLDVIDTGIGIPPDQQEKVFEEFRQLNNSTRDSSRGRGLGLAIVTRLASLLGTELQVSSQVGRGTRFSLLLPQDRAGRYDCSA